MRDKIIDKIIDKIMINIKQSNKLNDTKYAEIRYGLQTLYSLITKSFVTFILAFLLDIFLEFIIFLAFYVPLRSSAIGTHAKSNLQCWVFSILLLLGFPFIFSNLHLIFTVKIIIWTICFINFLIFSPADTAKKPMISKKRKLKFKLITVIICIIYIIIITYFENLSSLVIGAMILESFLVNPIGYLLFGEKIRFRLNDLYIFKQIR